MPLYSVSQQTRTVFRRCTPYHQTVLPPGAGRSSHPTPGAGGERRRYMQGGPWLPVSFPACGWHRRCAWWPQNAPQRNANGARLPAPLGVAPALASGAWGGRGHLADGADGAVWLLPHLTSNARRIRERSRRRKFRKTQCLRRQRCGCECSSGHKRWPGSRNSSNGRALPPCSRR